MVVVRWREGKVERRGGGGQGQAEVRGLMKWSRRAAVRDHTRALAQQALCSAKPAACFFLFPASTLRFSSLLTSPHPHHRGRGNGENLLRKRNETKH